MLSKLTSKNQITLPKKIMAHYPDTDYFDVSERQGSIVLTPVKIGGADAAREKLALLGIRRDDVKDAVKWARR